MRHFGGFYESLNDVFQNILKECSRTIDHGNWDEDVITGRLLGDMDDAVSAVGDTTFNSINCKAYKLVGIPERKAGDIAILVTLHLSPTKKITGVAFIEAKKLDFNTATYSAVKWDRLKKYSDISNCHRVMLYGESLDGDFLPSVHTMPSKLYIALGDKSRSISEFNEPLAWILLDRYFKGVELDFSDDAVQFVLTGVSRVGKVKLPDYALTANVALFGGLTLTTASVLDRSVNYTRLKSPAPADKPKGPDGGPRGPGGGSKMS